MQRTFTARPSTFGAAFVVLFSISAASAAPLAQLELVDYLGHTWTDQLVSVHVGPLLAGALPADKIDALRIVDAAGKAYPSQSADARMHKDGSLEACDLWTFVTLPANGRVTLSVEPGAPSAVDKPVTVANDGKLITLDNGTGEVALKLPAAIALAQPTPIKDIATPIQSIRLAGGKWIGKGWFTSAVPIKSVTSEVLSKGPLFAEARVAYRGDAGVHYGATIRVIRGKPVAVVAEEFNLPTPQDGPESAELKDPSKGGLIPTMNLSLEDGFQPDALRIKGRSMRPEFKPLHAVSPTEEGAYLLTRGVSARQASVIPAMSWWTNLGQYASVYRRADPATGPVLGVMKMRASHWFNPTSVQIWTDPKLGVYLSAVLGITHQRSWDVEGVHEPEMKTEIWSGRLDESLPRELGRREWALYFGTKAVAATEHYADDEKNPITQMIADLGEFPLEKVRRWVLDWDTTSEKHPRLMTRPVDVPALAEELKNAKPGAFGLTAPSAEVIASMTGSSTDVKSVAAQAESANGLALALLTKGATNMATHFFNLGLNLEAFVPGVDRALAVGGVPPDVQKKLKASLAFIFYAAADHDYYPIVSGFHLGNPNMPMILDAGLGNAGCVFPSHPASGAWLARGMSRGLDRFTRLVDPESGAWEECPHYMVDATFRPAFKMFFAMKAGGFHDFFTLPQMKKLMEYSMAIMSPPDPRFGIRIMATAGDGSLEGNGYLGWAAAAFTSIDPELSANLQWMWDADGRDIASSGDLGYQAIRPDLPAKAPKLRSTWYRGFGAILRNGFPDPKETWMVYRHGEKISHYCDGDQGTWHLYAKGAPLSLDFGSQYGPRTAQPWLFNRISVDHKADPMIGTQHDIDEFVPAPSIKGGADFVTATSVIERIGPMDETPYYNAEQGLDYTKLASIPKMKWHRSILFVRDVDTLGPNYFLVRDTFEGATKPTDWSCWSLASDVKFDGNTARFTGQHGVDLDVAMLAPGKPTFVQNRDAVPPPIAVFRSSYGPNIKDWPASLNEYRSPAQPHPPIFAHSFMYLAPRWKLMNGDKPFEERQICARVTQPANQGYFAVVYPRVAGTEEIPTYADWAAGQGAKLTFKDGSHYALSAPHQVSVKADKVDADAATAVVRDRGGKRELDLVRGARLKYGDLGIEGASPVAVRTDGKSLSGEIGGTARRVVIEAPNAVLQGKSLVIDGVKIGPTTGTRVEIDVEGGEHAFKVE